MATAKIDLLIFFQSKRYLITPGIFPMIVATGIIEKNNCFQILGRKKQLKNEKKNRKAKQNRKTFVMQTFTFFTEI